MAASSPLNSQNNDWQRECRHQVPLANCHSHTWDVTTSKWK